MIPILLIILLLPAFSSSQYTSTFEWLFPTNPAVVGHVSARAIASVDGVSFDDIWARTYANTLCRWDWDAKVWVRKENGIVKPQHANVQGVMQVSASTDGWAWATNTYGKAFRFDATSEMWVNTYNYVPYVQISAASKYLVIGVSNQRTIWTWANTDIATPGLTRWLQRGNTTTAQHASIGVDGDMWMANTTGAVHRWVSGDWMPQSTSPAMKSVSVHNAGRIVAFESATNIVHKWNGVGWSSLGFTASLSVAITDKKVYVLDGIHGFVLTPKSALLLDVIPVTPRFNASRLSARGSELWALTGALTGALPYRHNGTDWEQKSTEYMTDIASNMDGRVWATTNAGNLVRWNGSAFAPVTFELFGYVRIAAGNGSTNTAFAGLAGGNSCYIFDGTIWRNLCVGENRPYDIGMGIDDSTWKVDTVGILDSPLPSYRLQRWNGSGWITKSTSLVGYNLDVYDANRMAAIFSPQSSPYAAYYDGSGWKMLNIVANRIAISDSKIYFNSPNGVAYVQF